MKRSEAERLRLLRNGAMYRLFTGKGNGEDAKIAIETIAAICQVNKPVPINGLDGLVELALREGQRRVYLSIVECINAGNRERDETEWITRGDSNADEDE